MSKAKRTLIRSILTKRVMKVELSIPEQHELDMWLAESKHNRDLFRDLTDEKVFHKQFADFDEAESRLENADTVSGRIVRRPLFKYAAAAAVLLIAGTSYYLFTRTSQEATNPGPVADQTIKPIEILPGSNKAVLTLADNTQIVLDDKSGRIAQQGSTSISAGNGELKYENSSNQASPEAPGFNSVTTPRGGYSYRLSLSDGSFVYLNSESSLKYPPVFNNNERIVELTGEAYFEVARKLIPGSTKRIPFIVKTASQSIEVHGTRFDINDYRDQDGQTISTLLEGSVSVKAGNSSKLLKPGQRSILNNQSFNLSVEQTNAPDAIQWVSGAFAFNRTPLVQVMKEISRWYDVSYEFNKDITKDKLEDATITGSIGRRLALNVLLKNLGNVAGNNIQLSLKGRVIYVEISDSHEK